MHCPMMPGELTVRLSYVWTNGAEGKLVQKAIVLFKTLAADARAPAVQSAHITGSVPTSTRETCQFQRG